MIGRRPTIAAVTVIIFGRMRFTAPWITASWQIGLVRSIAA
jgi:hypothetical protein